MAELNKRQKLAKASLYDIGYDYLCKNFHKFSTENKIRVAISVIGIFNKDGSKTKPEFHTHFTVVVQDDGDQKSKSRVDAETELGLSLTDESV